MRTRTPNPYRPGFNQAPVVFAGRDDVIDGADEALEVAAYDGRTPRPLVLVGPRGLGKTVTLGEISDLAARKLSWPTVHVEAKPGSCVINDLIARLGAARALLEGTTAPSRSRSRVKGGKVSAHVLGIGGEVELEANGATEETLSGALAATMRAATARSAGVLVTVDEAQSMTADELGQLGGALQETVPEDWPLVVAMAALPSLRTNRGPRRLPTYLERAEWHELEFLPEPEARDALCAPAELAGRPMTEDAADLLLAAAGGYPYAIQVAGHFSWRASASANRITVAHARAALPRVRTDLEQLLRGRWDDASPKEREYLRALAAASAEKAAPTGADVAERLGVGTREVSYLRDRLIKKGTIYRDSGQHLRFITPGMAEWILGRDGGDTA